MGGGQGGAEGKDYKGAWTLGVMDVGYVHYLSCADGFMREHFKYV